MIEVIFLIHSDHLAQLLAMIFKQLYYQGLNDCLPHHGITVYICGEDNVVS